jgi:hypothetical protein
VSSHAPIERDAPGGSDGWTPTAYNHRVAPHHRRDALHGPPRSLHRRRVAAAEARRRRLLLIDLALGVMLALLAIVIAPGLAIVALVAVVVMLGYGLTLIFGWARRRRAVRRRRPR